MGRGKFGAYSILITIISGLISWFFSIAKSEIPTINSQIAVLESRIENNVAHLNEIKTDLRSLRDGQQKILELLINEKH